jgi:hypothetical protein
LGWISFSAKSRTTLRKASCSSDRAKLMVTTSGFR